MRAFRSIPCMRYLLPLLAVLFLAACEKDTAEPVYAHQDAIPLNEYEELIALADTSTLSGFAEFGARMERIQDIFAAYGDRRGAFTTLYAATTRATLATFTEANYDDFEYAQRMVLDFSKRYLYALHNHLLGRQEEFHWKPYYENARKDIHVTRLIFEGINAHITIDLARSLAHTGLQAGFEADFVRIGDNITPIVPEFLADLQNDYQTDAAELFGLYFVGDIVDAVFGEGAAVSFGFNLIRMEAFQSGLRLQVPALREREERRLRDDFRDRAAFVLLIDELGLTP